MLILLLPSQASYQLYLSDIFITQGMLFLYLIFYNIPIHQINITTYRIQSNGRRSGISSMGSPKVLKRMMRMTIPPPVVGAPMEMITAVILKREMMQIKFNTLF